jgi:hypothetical protein
MQLSWDMVYFQFHVAFTASLSASSQIGHAHIARRAAPHTGTPRDASDRA